MRSARIALAAALTLALVSGAAPPGGRALGDEDAREEIRLESSAGTVVFPHRMHADDLGIECDSCHHETDAAPLAAPHEDEFPDLWERCEACHHPAVRRTAPQPCDSCHRASMADAADETSSAKVVLHKSCWSCHEVGTGAEASRSCRSCHAPADPPEEAP